MASPSRGIVTPEAVVLDLTDAGIASRALAKAIDVAIQGAALVAIVLVAGLLADAVEPVVGIVLVVTGIAGVIFGYPALCETFARGRTPGKAALGLRVVTIEGGPVRGVHAFTRSVLQLVDFLLPPGGLFAVLAALFSPRNQRLGDLVAGTIVVRERSAAGSPMAVAFTPPQGWEPYALSLDVSRVTDDQYELVRSFLLRVAELDAGARVALASRLAGPLAERMGHSPPPGVHPEPFLVCVAAAHQRRSAQRHAPDGYAR